MLACLFEGIVHDMTGLSGIKKNMHIRYNYLNPSLYCYNFRHMKDTALTDIIYRTEKLRIIVVSV